MRRTDRVAMKRRENIADTKIRYEKKLRRLKPPKPDPALLPRTATAIGAERRRFLSLGSDRKGCLLYSFNSVSRKE